MAREIERPREVSPGVWWLGTCTPIPVSFQSTIGLSGAQAGKIIHAHQSCFVVVGRDATVIIDTGAPRNWPALRAQLLKVLQGRPLTYISPTHGEYPHYGNTANLLNEFPGSTVVGDVRDYGLAYPEHRGRLRQTDIGSALDLGERTVVSLRAVFRDLTGTRWSYDTASRVLFAADGFGYSHAHNAGECALTSSELAPTTVDDIAFVIRGAFTWSKYTNTAGHFRELAALFAQYPVEAIAPSHGSFIVDPDRMVRLMKKGFSQLNGFPLDDEDERVPVASTRAEDAR